MITKIITAILQFLDDRFRNVRCYSRCCQINECSCSNTDISIEDEAPHHNHRQHTPDSQISNHSHHSHHSHHSSDKDDLEKGL